ncbi:MAG: hypothetical protein SF029_20405, partial [bacterium]|nr:hypothetical protein [bacterium]
ADQTVQRTFQAMHLDPFASSDAEVCSEIAAGRLSQAARLYRALAHCSPQEARDAVLFLSQNPHYAALSKRKNQVHDSHLNDEHPLIDSSTPATEENLPLRSSRSA